MLYDPIETLTELSALMDLHPGDLLLTGTPAGVALNVPGGLMKRMASFLFSEDRVMQIFVKRQLQNARYLKDGDLIQPRLQGPSEEIDSGIMELQVKG